MALPIDGSYDKELSVKGLDVLEIGDRTQTKKERAEDSGRAGATRLEEQDFSCLRWR